MLHCSFTILCTCYFLLYTPIQVYLIWNSQSVNFYMVTEYLSHLCICSAFMRIRKCYTECRHWNWFSIFRNTFLRSLYLVKWAYLHRFLFWFLPVWLIIIILEFSRNDSAFVRLTNQSRKSSKLMPNYGQIGSFGWVVCLRDTWNALEILS